MNYSLLVTYEALADIEDALEWYESKQRNLGKEFSETTLNYLDYLSHNAHSHPKVRGEYRELVMKRFPYVFIYRITKNQEVLVLGIIHTKKHPVNRRKRK